MDKDIAQELQKLIRELMDNLPDGVLTAAAEDYYICKLNEIMGLALIEVAA